MKSAKVNTSKRITAILSVAAVSILSIGMLTACKKESATEASGIEVSSAEVSAVEESGTEVTGTEEVSFGLKDYEGFYCRTETEQIEDFEVTRIYGYKLNGDGTGVSFGQDVVDFTWNETELHFGDSTETFLMEPGKLTVGNLVYDKITGNFITPNPCEVDTDNIENGIYNVCIDESGITETDGKYTIRTEIYTEETYDIVDINRMAEGDVIYINGQLLPVNLITKTDNGFIEVNGGIENGGSALRPVDESNCYVYCGMDMESSYARRGIAGIAVSDNVKLIDNRDPAEEKVYTGSEAVSALKEIVKDYPMTCYECIITVENGEIIEIHRIYRP